MKYDMATCGGCRTCEIACSYHHAGVFHPSTSSIKILTKNDGKGYHVVLLEMDEDVSKACDLCAELDVPVCIEVCKEREELRDILLRFAEYSGKDVTWKDMPVKKAQQL